MQDYGNTFTLVFVLPIFGIKLAKVVRQHGSTNPASLYILHNIVILVIVIIVAALVT